MRGDLMREERHCRWRAHGGQPSTFIKFPVSCVFALLVSMGSFSLPAMAFDVFRDGSLILYVRPSYGYVTGSTLLMTDVKTRLHRKLNPCGRACFSFEDAVFSPDSQKIAFIALARTR